jgi:DNA-binding NtrC family response regulator
MEASFQAKLLRALQEKEIIRIGSNKPVKVDCRIIVASNKDLLEEVKKGNFREDLYYRLIGLPIHLPPLRERENDVLILAKFFIDHFSSENDLPHKMLSAAAQKKLLYYHFPGNIRELKSTIELAVTLSSGKEIESDDIILHSSDNTTEILNEELTLREYERRIVDTYLKKYDNNAKLVAQKLDIGLSTIYRMLKEDESPASK